MTPETSLPFGGFREDNLGLIRIPEAFFTQLLPLIENLSQIKLLLYMFWHLEQQEGEIRFFLFDDLVSDPGLLQMMGHKEALKEALDGLVNIGAVLEAKPAAQNHSYYFINGPQGRSAIIAIQQDQWKEAQTARLPIHLTQEQPNIFRLYEQNIGAITPMMAEILKEDEITYPGDWIKDAIKIAVSRNARNWKYVQAILERWQKEGRGDEKNRRNSSQDPESYRESWLGNE